MIEIKNLSKIYNNKKDNEVQAIKNISLSFLDTGLVFIVGKSGSGKSTLLNLLGGLDSFNEGNISIDGKSLSDFTDKDLDYYRNHNLGFVFQEFNLLEDYTVYKNLELAMRLQGNVVSYQEIDKLLDDFQLKDLGKRKINQLSGGQKQRVALARALIKKPKIILCDEPTGSLDEENSRIIFQLLKKISQQNLVIVVSHDVDSALFYGDRVIELSDGKIKKDTILNSKTMQLKEKTKEKNMKSSFFLKHKFSLSLTYLKKRPIRLGISIFLSLLCFILVGVSFSISSMNQDKLIVNSLYENDIRYLSYFKSTYQENGDMIKEINLSDDDINYLSKKLKTKDYSLVYDYFSGLLPHIDTEFAYINHNFYYTQCNGFMEINSELINKYNYNFYGRLPENDDELVISKYFFDTYKQYGYEYQSISKKIEKYDDLIGEKISVFDQKMGSSIFTIVGILDTNFNNQRYFPLLNNPSDNQSSILSYEIQTMMEHGMHNIYFFNDGYYDRNIKSLSNDQYPIIPNASLSDVFYISNVIGDYGSLKFERICKDKENSFNIFYKNDQEKELSQNKILLPLSLTRIRMGSDYSNILDQVFEDILTFCNNHFFEIQDEFEKDGGYNGGIDELAYFDYIVDHDENKYHPEKNFKFFEKPYIQQNLQNNHFESFSNIQLEFDNKLEYDVELIGFFDDENQSAFKNTILVSPDLLAQFKKDMGYLVYDYKYLITPVTKNYNQDVQRVSIRNERRNEKIFILEPQENLEKITSSYSQYHMNNEVTYSLNNVEGILDFILIVFKYVAIALVLIIILFLNYYFSGLIIDKKREIGVLRAMGTSKKDIVQIFLGEGIILLGIISFLSILANFIIIKVGNSYMMNHYYLLISLLNFSIFQMVLLVLLCAFSIFLGILIPLYNLIKKKPIDIIYH